MKTLFKMLAPCGNASVTFNSDSYNWNKELFRSYLMHRSYDSISSSLNR